jgi:hypothetical protein
MAVAVSALESGAAIRRKHKKKRRRDELPFAVSGPPQAGKKLDAADVIALQKLLGNKATQEVLKKQQKDGTSEDTATKERFINEHVREMLKIQLKERMSDAAENYEAAWEAFRKDLAVEASFNPELGKTIVENFLADHGQMSKDLFKLVGGQFPILDGSGMDQATLRSLDPAKEQKDFFLDKGKDPMEEAAEKVTKAAAATGGNVENRILLAIKDHLARMTEEFDDMDEEMTDLDLLLLWTNYEEKLVKEELYKAMAKIIVAEAKRIRLEKLKKQRATLGSARGGKSSAGGGDAGDGGADSNKK